jgi:hypothetical protein
MGASVIDKWTWSAGGMILTEQKNPKYSEKNLSQCNFDHHKSQMEWNGIKPRPRRCGADGTAHDEGRKDALMSIDLQ